MGMLDRIKKCRLDGFKEFVLNMETSGIQSRQQIFTAGVLEDPLFMGWVMKNLRSFDDFLTLPSDEIDTVLQDQEQMLGIFAKAMFGTEEIRILRLESIIPQLMSRFKDEFSYLKDISPQERDSARYYVLKTTRKLQLNGKIQGFHWKLPPMDIFYPKNYKDGGVQIYFENGMLAAEGEYLKGRRMGEWKHYYDTGKILAEGGYIEGFKSGVWIFYYGNGNIRAQGKYFSDLKNGLWKEWDRNGNLVENEYKEGVKI